MKQTRILQANVVVHAIRTHTFLGTRPE